MFPALPLFSPGRDYWTVSDPTIHWEHMPAFAEAFPEIVSTGTLFEIDRSRLTCGGGIAALDMMHEIIRRDHGETLAALVSDWYLQTAVRLGTAPSACRCRNG